MIILSKVKNRNWSSRIIQHGIFWIGIVLLLAYHGSLFGGDFRSNVLYMISILPIQMIAAYALTYYQIPEWFFRGNWIKFILGSAVIAYILAAAARASVIYIGEPLMGVDGIDESIGEILTDPMYLIRVYMASAYLPAVLFFLIKMTKERFVKEQEIVALEMEKRTTELNFLKAQINPHFLFNTLNNIYALARERSEDTPDMILKLSEILDYTIYDCRADRVSIQKEWELIENYADLQALRHHDRMTIVLNQDIENEQAPIAPLILISLVENAFKHGLKGNQEMSTVDISLVENRNKIIFKIFNTRSLDQEHFKKGIGDDNIRRQLELQYKDGYSLDVVPSPSSYQVTLSINLKKDYE